MATTALVLHGETLWISPYVFSSWVALREKGVPFVEREVALIDLENRSPAYLERNPTGQVPALEHGGFCCSESSAIAEYLEDAFPPPGHGALFPSDPRDRARARQLMAWFRSNLGAVRDERPTVTMFYDRATRPLSARGLEAAASLQRVAGRFVRRDDEGLFGAWCLADAELAFMLHRLILNGDDVAPRLAAWAAREWRRPAVAAFVAHPRPATCPERYWDMPANAGATRPYASGVV